MPSLNGRANVSSWARNLLSDPAFTSKLWETNAHMHSFILVVAVHGWCNKYQHLVYQKSIVHHRDSDGDIRAYASLGYRLASENQGS